MHCVGARSSSILLPLDKKIKYRKKLVVYIQYGLFGDGGVGFLHSNSACVIQLVVVASSIKILTASITIL